MPNVRVVRLRLDRFSKRGWEVPIVRRERIVAVPERMNYSGLRVLVVLHGVSMDVESDVLPDMVPRES